MITMNQLTESVKILQKCALWSEGKVLLLRRAENEHTRPGMWDLPGGNVEWPSATESALNPHIQDLVREILEETGFNFSVREFSQPCYVQTYFDAEKNVYSVVLGWKLDLPDTSEPTPKLSSEHTEYAWVPPSKLNDYDFGFAGGPNGFISKILAA